MSKIIPGGSAAATDKLRMGDRILAVNTTDIRNVSHQEAVMSLLQPCEIIKLTVQHDPLPPSFIEITVNKTEEEKLDCEGGLNTGSIASKDSRIKVKEIINLSVLLRATSLQSLYFYIDHRVKY